MGKLISHLVQSDNYLKKFIDSKFSECVLGTIKGSDKCDNQDVCGYVSGKDFDFYFVSDGMGGTKHGGEVVNLIANNLIRDLSKKESITFDKIVLSVESTNKQIFEKFSGSGATLSAVLIYKDFMRFINIGDSGQFLFDRNKNILYKGIEQSLVGYALESGLVDNRLGNKDLDPSIISNAIGFKNMKIEMSTKLAYKKNYTVLLCSDGFFQFFNENEIKNPLLWGRFKDRLKQFESELERKDAYIEDDSSVLLIRLNC